MHCVFSHTDKGKMKPGGLERVRIGRETRQSILAGNLGGYGSDCESRRRPMIIRRWTRPKSTTRRACRYRPSPTIAGTESRRCASLRRRPGLPELEGFHVRRAAVDRRHDDDAHPALSEVCLYALRKPEGDDSIGVAGQKADRTVLQGFNARRARR
jgi:hypothetical protein